MQDGYRLLDHKADLGLEVTSRTLEGLFEVSAAALFEVIAPQGGTPRIAREVCSEGPDEAALLVNFLNDLLALFEVEGLLFRRIKVEFPSPGRLRAGTLCEPMDPERTPVETVVKAVTWHGLEVRRESDAWRGVVYLDL